MDDIELLVIDGSNKEVLRNLFNLYHHDLSIVDASLFPSVDQNGFYDYTAIDEYYNNEFFHNELFGYIIQYNGNTAGFCIISKAPFVKTGCDYCIQEFFVTGNYRRKGIGSKVSKIIFKEYPGRYCLQIVGNNIKAKSFWKQLANSVGSEVVANNDDTVLTFIV